MIVLRQLFSVATSLWVITNLTIAMLLLFVLAALKLIFGWQPTLRHGINWLIELLYKAAAYIDSFWMLNVVGINISVEGELPEHPAPIVIVNHQTWFDIPVLQHVITGQGPTLKFLIKRQLVWVPIVGWICWALGFPRLNRGQGDGAREKDYAAIASASNTLINERGALLIFAEGTRFTPAKQALQASPFQHLLVPKPGGLKIALSAVHPETPIIDVSIAYHGTTNFWLCLGGATPKIDVRLESFTAGSASDAREWLMQRWQAKDQWMKNVL